MLPNKGDAHAGCAAQGLASSMGTVSRVLGCRAMAARSGRRGYFRGFNEKNEATGWRANRCSRRQAAGQRDLATGQR
jgi:hypothetical protein